MTQNKEPRTKNQEHISAIILAAGQSSRMGAFKPLLPFGAKTVIESCIDYLNRGGVETIIVVIGYNGGETIKAQVKHLPVRFALNPNPGSEMSDSIRYGACELPEDSQAIFITPVDHPAIPAAVVSSLINEWRDGKDQLLIPEFNGRGGHPVLIDSSFRDDLLHLDPKRGLRGLFEDHQTQLRRLPVASPYVARDMDTWDDYRNLHFEVFGTEPKR
jgi:molybdenum cofactor cytidylyltransferase